MNLWKIILRKEKKFKRRNIKKIKKKSGNFLKIKKKFRKIKKNSEILKFRKQ